MSPPYQLLLSLPERRVAPHTFLFLLLMMRISILRLAHALLAKAAHGGGWPSGFVASVELRGLHWLWRRYRLTATEGALLALALRHGVCLPSLKISMPFLTEATLVLHHALFLDTVLLVRILHPALLLHVLHPALLLDVLHSAPILLHSPLLFHVLHPALFLHAPFVLHAAIIHTTVITYHRAPAVITWVHAEGLVWTQSFVAADAP